MAKEWVDTASAGSVTGSSTGYVNSFYRPKFNRAWDFFYNYKENVLKPFKELIKN